MSKILDHLKTHKWGYLLGILIVLAVAIQAVYKPISLDILRGDLAGSVTGAKTAAYTIQLPSMQVSGYFEKNFMDTCEGCTKGADIKLQEGAFPPGMQFDNGYLRGKLAKAGTYTFTLKMGSASKNYMLTVE